MCECLIGRYGAAHAGLVVFDSDLVDLYCAKVRIGYQFTKNEPQSIYCNEMLLT